MATKARFESLEASINDLKETMQMVLENLEQLKKPLKTERNHTTRNPFGTLASDDELPSDWEEDEQFVHGHVCKNAQSLLIELCQDEYDTPPIYDEEESTREPNITLTALIGEVGGNSMRLEGTIDKSCIHIAKNMQENSAADTLSRREGQEMLLAISVARSSLWNEEEDTPPIYPIYDEEIEDTSPVYDEEIDDTTPTVSLNTLMGESGGKSVRMVGNLKEVVQLLSDSRSTSLSEAAMVEENRCASSIIRPGDSSLKQLKPVKIDGHASVSSDSAHDLSKKSTTELPGIHGVSELSSSENVVLDDSRNGIQQVESKWSTFKYLNWPNPIRKNFLPRSLVNLGNLCFLNATLQALLSRSPFLEMLHELRNRDIPEIGYPTLRAFVDFISDFDMLTDSVEKRNENSALQTGIHFRPVMFDSILKSFTPDIPDNLSGRPRREDAQEFLSFVMHDELLKLKGQVPNGNGKTTSLVSSTDDESEDDNWETVGPRNETAITRTQSFLPSKLSSIFSGQLRSVVKARGNKTSATIQPFILLHLNICPEPICTVEDALRLFSAPETLEGYGISVAGKAKVVTASKSVKILELSEIMVLHLMRFTYGSQGSTKLHKTVHFPLELLVGHKLLASPTSEARRYELKLPPATHVHPVFHVSLLRRCIDDCNVEIIPLPPLTEQGLPVIEPEEVLATRSVLVKGVPQTHVLIKWKSLAAEDATWEIGEELRSRFPQFQLGDKSDFVEGRDVETGVSPIEAALEDPHLATQSRSSCRDNSTRAPKPTWKVAAQLKQ